MDNTTNIATKPPIVVSELDFDRIAALLEDIGRQFPAAAKELQTEIDRAQLVPADAMAPDVIRMGSTVVFQSQDAQRRQVRLVFPGDADIAQGKVSILSPVGTALLGLSPGQSIAWTAPDGRRHALTVLEVQPPR